MPDYPQHEKLMKVKHQSQPIGQFLEWFTDNGYIFYKWDNENQTYTHYQHSIPELLTEYFGINLKELGQEKRDMINELDKGSQYAQKR